jgi:hypothetical protein
MMSAIDAINSSLTSVIEVARACRMTDRRPLSRHTAAAQ